MQNMGYIIMGLVAFVFAIAILLLLKYSMKKYPK